MKEKNKTYEMQYVLYYDGRPPLREVRILDRIRADNDRGKTYQVVGIFPPNTKQGGNTGKIICISSKGTIHKFYPYICHMSFYFRKNKNHKWEKLDRYGRPVIDKY